MGCWRRRSWLAVAAAPVESTARSAPASEAATWRRTTSASFTFDISWLAMAPAPAAALTHAAGEAVKQAFLLRGG